MYRKIEPALQMTRNEATERYPNDYILIRWRNNHNPSDDIGTVLYVGDDDGELFSLVTKLNDPSCGVSEGLNLQRSLGGLVVGV